VPITIVRFSICALLACASLVACSGDEPPPADSGGDVVVIDSGTLDTGGDAALSACPGYTPPGPMAMTCTDHAACATFGSCYAPGTSCCPVGMVAPRDCESDAGCSDGDVCEEYLASGPCTGGLGSRCVPDCRIEDMCVDATCDALGHCIPLECPREFECAVNQDCSPGNAAADANGCVVRSCTTGSECDCGACVNGSCQDGPGTCQGDCACAAPDTPIATPDGERAIADLRAGDLVYSVDGDAIVVVPLRYVGQRPAPLGHRVVRVTLESGRSFDMSPGHPTADGRTLSELDAGDDLGALGVTGVEVVLYEAEHTYDILPASSSGAYFAAGALVGSTLGR